MTRRAEVSTLGVVEMALESVPATSGSVRPSAASPREGGKADLARQLRNVLSHLYDLTYLQTHPLARALSPDTQAGRTTNPGKVLRQVLLDAIEALRSDSDPPSGSSADRTYQLLHLRYVEGLEVGEVERRLAIGKSEYHRDLRKAIAALALLLAARFGFDQASIMPLQAGGRVEAVEPAPVGAPPVRMVFRGNLPTPLTSFVGRDREVEDVKGRLAQRRLVTLTGVGGSGKTRLALHVAAEVRPEYADGVWLVELGPLADPALVPQAVAVALGLVEETGYPIASTLIDHLRSRRCLLVLDNCEHLVDACAKMVEALLRACPDAAVLATSREALRIDGEVVYLVPPLAVPDLEEQHRLDDLLGYGGVQLFVQRAASVARGFELTAKNAPSVARICARLDGLPLAIELAAARVRVLTPEQIALRLDDRFRLLTGGNRSALPRQQTLAAALDWSYDLLAEPERCLFRRLAVFAGGWSLEAAEAVCADELVDASQALDLLTGLVDRSLVLAEAQDGEARYRLLETVREYAWGKLTESGEVEWARERHRDWALALAEEVKYSGHCLTLWPPRLRREHDNFRAALEWSRTQASGAEAELRLATALAHFQRSWGYESEAQERLGRALARSVGLLPATRAAALMWLGIWETYDGHPSRARELYDESLALAQQVGDPVLLACVLRHLAWSCEDFGRLPEALKYLEEALPIARQAGDAFETAIILEAQGEIYSWQGDRARARQVLAEGLAISEAAGESEPSSYCRSDLGKLALAERDYARARYLFEAGLEFAQALGSRKSIAYGLADLGDVARAEGDLPSAEALYRESLRAARESGTKMTVTHSLGRLVDLWSVQGSHQDAARLYGMLDAFHAATGNAMPVHRHPDHDRDLAATRGALGEEAFARAFAEGQAMTLDEAVEHALQNEPEA